MVCAYFSKGEKKSLVLCVWHLPPFGLVAPIKTPLKPPLLLNSTNPTTHQSFSCVQVFPNNKVGVNIVTDGLASRCIWMLATWWWRFAFFCGRVEVWYQKSVDVLTCVELGQGWCPVTQLLLKREGFFYFLFFLFSFFILLKWNISPALPV